MPFFHKKGWKDINLWTFMNGLVNSNNYFIFCKIFIVWFKPRTNWSILPLRSTTSHGTYVKSFVEMIILAFILKVIMYISCHTFMAWNIHYGIFFYIIHFMVKCIARKDTYTFSITLHYFSNFIILWCLYILVPLQIYNSFKRTNANIPLRN